MHINRGLHIARSLSSTNLISITCGHMTAFLSNQTEHMMEFSLSLSVNMNFMSARRGRMISHKARQYEFNPLHYSEPIQAGRNK